MTPQWDPGTPWDPHSREAQSFEAAVVAGAKGDGKDAEANGGSSCWLCPLKMWGKLLHGNFNINTVDNDDA